MSLIPSQSHINPGSVVYAGDKVSVANSQINVTVPGAVVNTATQQSIGTLTSSLYPTVGKTYMISMSFTYDMTFATTPNGKVSIGLGYTSDGGTTYLPLAQEGGYCGGTTTQADVYGTLSLIFTHTSATNTVRLTVSNFAGTNISACSIVLITGLSVVELSSDAGIITGTPIA